MQRCKSEEIAGIAGLWADLDLRSDAHPKTTLPGNIEQALSILPPEFLYIGQYLTETTFIGSIEGQMAQERRRPMVRDGRITICAPDLQMHINKTTQQNLSVRSVAAMLSAIGAKAVRVRGKKIREQSRWELPLEEFDPSDYFVPEMEGGDDR